MALDLAKLFWAGISDILYYAHEIDENVLMMIDEKYLSQEQVREKEYLLYR
jgi:hypothetical protein